jgi:SAM-dependent methyltransferase
MAEEEKRAVRLNLGCGDDVQPGYVNHDFARHRPEVEVVHDLRVLPWPWADESAETIRLLDVLEHLPQVVPVIDECWRVLRPGGALHLRVPHYQSENAWLDPTHRRPFHLDSFDYFDPDTAWGTKYGFYTQRKWKLGSKRLLHGNVVVFMHARKGAGETVRDWVPHTEEERLYKLSVEIAELVPRWASYILVGAERWEDGAVFADRRSIPFLERDGQYWGRPADDETAIRELERLRQSGASYMLFAWPAFWWLDHYSRLNDHLRTRFRCLLENDRLIAFDLRGGGKGGSLAEI